MNKKSNYHLVIALIALSSLIYFLVMRQISLASIQYHADKLVRKTYQYPLASVILYILSYGIAAFLPLPGESLLNVTGGYLYGRYRGILYAVMGSTLGSTLAFLTTRFLASSWVKKHLYRQYQFIQNNMLKYGPFFLLALRFIPATPAWMINFIAGLTTISLPIFLLITLIGVTPGTSLYVIAGQKLHELTSLRDILTPSWILLLLALALFALLPPLIHYFLTKRGLLPPQ